ncbi:hypothetical protein BDF20DRAFT_861568 [Mycotypha africana]|uniref:uncharacterized protein n=1 Tax=Mycotypha africana TaxID=64632 RepID=UPI00230037D4|nr:uncharacterized protein BDF20DRAFT_861568 [Mycotypha africana]KAI8984751.1 hypothetical protein BDF20DRAFT_861568 [Mycotypha africana]
MVCWVVISSFTAPCKEGLVFISNKTINVADTAKFNSFTKSDYDAYIENKLAKNNGILEDTDPAAWFSLSNSNRTNILDVDYRSCKYILIKMLRSHFDSDNIDLQYIGFIGHVGTASFAQCTLR